MTAGTRESAPSSSPGASDPTAAASPREGDGHLETRSDRERAAAGEHIKEEEHATMKIDRKKSIQNRDHMVSHVSAPWKKTLDFDSISCYE
jgi:hypothetical protein